MSLNDTTTAVFGVSYETIIRRIIRTFDSATPSDIEAGAQWYDQAGALAATLSASIGDVDRAACLIAALSPRTTWTRNVAGAVAMATYGATYEPEGHIGTNVARAARVLDSVDPYAALGNGPKVAAFARNIAGDRESVTVDVWACRVADLDETLLGRRGAYEAVASAYRAAARRRGVDPATMQATTWVVARNGRAA